jgi:hypothetical protein
MDGSGDWGAGFTRLTTGGCGVMRVDPKENMWPVETLNHRKVTLT